MYAVLAGGIGAARFLRGLVQVVDPADLHVITNVGDDITLHGLRVCPDLDTITYTLGGVIHPQQQWGRADETTAVAEELRRFGSDEAWFTLGDRDLALHLYRTRRLHEGAGLAEVTREVASAFGLSVHLLPATEHEVATRVHTADGRDLHFQEYWVGERGAPLVERVELAGAAAATPAPGVIEAILDAEAVLVCPSNPVVSIGTILDIPGIPEALRTTRAPIVGVSPIVGGAVIRGMADRLLPSRGVPVTALGVATLYRDWIDGWVVDDADAGSVAAIEGMGIACCSTDTLMDDPAIAAALAGTVLDLAAGLRTAAA